MGLLLFALATAACAKNGFLGQPGTAEPETRGAVGAYWEESAPTPQQQTPPQQSPAPVAQSPSVAAEHPGAVAAPQPPAASAAPQRIGGFVVRDPASRRIEEKTRERRGLSDAVADRPAARAGKPGTLWGTVGAPVEMTPDRLSKAGLDDAQSAANDEYERRILGGETPQRPASSPLTLQPSTNPGKLFVSVEMSLPGEAPLRDAVADLTRATGFTLDPRFPAEPAMMGASPTAARRVAVRGWLPTARIGDAARAPGVTRLEVERGGSMPSGTNTRTSLLVGLRMPVQMDAAPAFQRLIAELSQTADLRWRRTIGFQNLPGTTDVALVIAADVPITRIPRLLEHPAVLKITPVEAPAVEPGAVESSTLARFARYARHQAPLLILATLIALLPSLGGWFKRRRR